MRKPPKTPMPRVDQVKEGHLGRGAERGVWAMPARVTSSGNCEDTLLGCGA